MILEQFHLNEKIALVTGGTKGLGRAVAIALAGAGADIVVVSRNADKGIEDEILSLGRRYFHHSADLTERNQTRMVIPAIVEVMGGIDILVNNSGIIRKAPLIDYSEEDWDVVLEIDLTAAFILSQAAGRIMLKRGKGKIINIASILSFQGASNIVSYVVAKHGLVGLTKAFANEWAKRSINVNAIAPSFFITEFTEGIHKDLERFKSITARTPAGRWGDPLDVAGAVVFLASSASDFIHGVILPIDGGWMVG
jgi:2-deoxy-D-gluconate 3-dehydrogenase